MDKYLIIIHMEDGAIELEYDGAIDLEYKDDDFVIIEDKQRLVERWLIGVPKPYSARVERGVGANCELQHIHVFHKDNQIFSMNSDGSVHDGASGRIPNKILTYLNNNLPEWNWPSNRLVENEAYDNFISEIQQYYALFA